MRTQKWGLPLEHRNWEKKETSRHAGMYLQSQCWVSLPKWIPGAHWPVLLAYWVFSRPVRDPVWINKAPEEEYPRLSSDLLISSFWPAISLMQGLKPSTHPYLPPASQYHPFSCRGLLLLPLGFAAWALVQCFSMCVCTCVCVCLCTPRSLASVYKLFR